MTSTARIWALADPNLISSPKASAAIEQAFRTALGATDRSRHRVTIMPGFIEHEDTRGLWNAGDATALSAEQARDYAVKTITTVSKALSTEANKALANAIGPMQLVPPQVKPIDVLPIASMQSGSWDHWLVRSRPQLTLDVTAGTYADVFGAEVDVRIGPAGAVLGYLSRWRPLSGEHIDVDLSAPPATASNTDPNHPAQRTIAFVLEGESAPQHYLAPYYLIANGEDLELASASPLSLVVHITRYSSEDPTQYVAVVEGGSGDYRFDWGLLPLSDFTEITLAHLGEGQTVTDRSTNPASSLSVVTLPIGAHLALLNVIDQQTGAFQHHSEQVYVAGSTSAGASGGSSS